MKDENMVSLRLKPKEEKRILSGHCWIFSNELEEVDTSIPAGTYCRVFASDGVFIGVGFYNPHTLISVRMLTRRAELAPDFVLSRLTKAYEYRKSLGLDEYARMCFGEADGMPGLVVDRFGDYLAVEILSAGMDAVKSDITSALEALFKPKGIIFRNDSEFRRMEGLSLAPETSGEVPDEAVIDEGGVKYLVPLRAGQKTGFYYDQRENRSFLEPYFRGRKVMDLYSYVGGFALKAAASGAEKVWGVDSSQFAIDRAKSAAERNGLNVIFHKDDSERVLSGLKNHQLPEQPDMVVLDPPNFVKSRKNLGQALKLYSRLNEMALRGLPSGGLLASATCSHHVTREVFMDMLKAAVTHSGREVMLVELRGQAKDHPVLIGVPETEYLHFALLRVK